MQAPLHVSRQNLEATVIPGAAAFAANRSTSHAATASTGSSCHSGRVPKPSAKVKLADEDPDIDLERETSSGPNKRGCVTQRKCGGTFGGQCAKRIKRAHERGPSTMALFGPLAASQDSLQNDGLRPSRVLPADAAATLAQPNAAAAAMAAVVAPQHAKQDPEEVDNKGLEQAVLQHEVGGGGSGAGGVGRFPLIKGAEPRWQRSRFRGVCLQRCDSSRVLKLVMNDILLSQDVCRCVHKQAQLQIERRHDVRGLRLCTCSIVPLPGHCFVWFTAWLAVLRHGCAISASDADYLAILMAGKLCVCCRPMSILRMPVGNERLGACRSVVSLRLAK